MHQAGRPLFALVFLAATHAAGQAVTVQGLVYDSLHHHPLANAVVSLASKVAATDSMGRFVVSGIIPGEYRATAQHDVIDRLGIPAIGAAVRITDGRSPVLLVIPSFSGLWRLACGPTPPLSDTGFIFGTVRSRDRQRVMVFGSWIDLAVNGVRVLQKRRTLEVAADSLGNFALCGVPTGTAVAIRATADGAESGEFSLGPLDPERIARRDLILGMPLSMVIAAGRGASIKGIVLADSGRRPIVGADVSLVQAGRSTITNERGEFAFNDLLPGSDRLHARRLGYAATEVRVDIEEAERRQIDIVMAPVTILDSVAVTAHESVRDEALRLFEEHRRMGLGRFLSPEELQAARGRKLSELINQWPGLRVASSPGDSYPQSTRGVKSIVGEGCDVAVFFDGRLLDPKTDRDLDHIAPPDILAGVEWYAGVSTVPPEYARLNNHCGVLVLHSKYKNRVPF
jgi:hypothetical protein